MATPPRARGRKTRLVRPGQGPNDLLRVIRATPASREETIAKIAEHAEVSAETYVVELGEGRRELLYGVSVFALRPEFDSAAVLDRFPGASAFIDMAIGTVRNAGFEVLATGDNADHFDIQLIGGVTENATPPPPAAVRAAAARLLAAVGDLRPNPSYAGGAGDSSEEER